MPGVDKFSEKMASKCVGKIPRVCDWINVRSDQNFFFPSFSFFLFSFFLFFLDITAPRQRRLARRVTSGKGLKQKANSSRSTKTQIRAALQELLENLPAECGEKLCGPSVQRPLALEKPVSEYVCL